VSYVVAAANVLYPILKEHQITTERRRRLPAGKLYPILKEHQITTDLAGERISPRLYPILKEHQITTREVGHGINILLYPILKEHQITTTVGRGSSILNCIPFSKSIKSQLIDDNPVSAVTVSHSQRASNHNRAGRDKRR